MAINNAANYQVTQYNTITGGANNTLNNVSPGTSGQILTSNGASSQPTFQTAIGGVSVNIQTFTSTGTYTPTANMVYCTIECIGGGGGGGATSTTGVGTVTCAGGGGGGGYARKTVSAATIGSSQSVTIGAAGSAGAVAGGTGGTGGTTSVGSLCVATGGVGGTGGGANSQTQGYTVPGGAAGAGTTGDVLMTSEAGGAGVATGVNYSLGGAGGDSYFGGGGAATSTGGLASQNAGTNYGGGGSGCATGGGGNTQGAGGAGSKGYVIITEYIGQAAVTTLGVASGGTGATSFTAYGILQAGATSTSALTDTSAGTSGQLLQSAGSAPAGWTTATFPATAGTSGNVLTSNGTNWSSSALPGIPLYYNSVSLTNSQIKNLNTTSVQIVPAQGAGTIIVPVSAVIKLYYGGTNAFSGGTATHLVYGDTAETNIIFGATTSSFWNKTANEYLVPLTNTTGSAFIFPATSAENVDVSISTSTSITGNAAANNTATVAITYYVISI